MYEFHPYFTADGSVGLYSPEFNDIYHSASGALTEAYEKFILPSNINYLIENKSEIKVLDICYGIGYNTKSFLNFIFKNFSNKNSKSTHYYEAIDTNKNCNLTITDNAPIHTDKNINIQQENYSSIYTNKNCTHKKQNNEAIHAYNIFPKISITAVDNDEKLFYLSPFIKTGEKNFESYNSTIPNEKIQKYMSANSSGGVIKVDNLINFFIFNEITRQNPDFLSGFDISSIISDKKFAPFFERDLRGIFELLSNKCVCFSILDSFNSFLHNIYYHHVSLSYKNRLNASILKNVSLNFKTGDARKIISGDTNKYHLIFLDAFTPSKCPCLWSYEFFLMLFNHLEPDGMILTYSSSASVRSAMLAAGFYIGNIFSRRENKFIGTVAVKDKTFIKYPLSNYESGLLNTRAGIFYRDENLNAQNEEIIERRNSEVKNSNRQSSSEYKKSLK